LKVLEAGHNDERPSKLNHDLVKQIKKWFEDSTHLQLQIKKQKVVKRSQSN